METVNIDDWNREWSNPNSGCRYQSTEVDEVRGFAGTYIVEIIGDPEYKPFYGAVSASGLARMQGGK